VGGSELLGVAPAAHRFLRSLVQSRQPPCRK
jgi:hypothetical protein